MELLKKIICSVTEWLLLGAVVLAAAFSFGLAVSKNKDRSVQKYKMYFKLMSDWMDLLENGRSFQGYFRKNGLCHVAVYGGNIAGWHLARQLNRTDRVVSYMIDKTAFSDKANLLPTYRPDDNLPDVDAVIVTPVWDFQRIKKQLEERVACPVISLEDMIAEVKNG